ncbi:MAG: hypothetical protein KDM91_19845 [Verrucomicrobiae bacterium]|nr:hypothetical protein [Verrucomicrobiae bacterium]MCP5540422.1 hypothetical protein [Akkermansiaceae bacterium]
MRLVAIAVFAVAFVAFCPPGRSQEEKKAEIPVDPATGIKMAENWELIRAHCVICHSSQQFLRQRGTRSTWTDILGWMQTSGGLWKLDAEIEGKIIDYLSENYGPDAFYRRAPIPATLLPENPYESDARKEYEEKKQAGQIPGKAPAP